MSRKPFNQNKPVVKKATPTKQYNVLAQAFMEAHRKLQLVSGDDDVDGLMYKTFCLLVDVYGKATPTDNQ